eukprot:4773325-Heterocapsa_arctica.AAC.1
MSSERSDCHPSVKMRTGGVAGHLKSMERGTAPSRNSCQKLRTKLIGAVRLDPAPCCRSDRTRSPALPARPNVWAAANPSLPRS